MSMWCIFMHELEWDTHHHRRSWRKKNIMAIGFYEKFTAHDWSSPHSTFLSVQCSLLFLILFPRSLPSSRSHRNKYSLIMGKVTTIGCWVSGFLNFVLGYSIFMGIWTILVGFLIAIWELPATYFWFSKVWIPSQDDLPFLTLPDPFRSLPLLDWAIPRVLSWENEITVSRHEGDHLFLSFHHLLHHWVSLYSRWSPFNVLWTSIYFCTN